MRRRLFTLCSALSLLMCAAVCGLWVRSDDYAGAVVTIGDRLLIAECADTEGIVFRDVRHWPGHASLQLLRPKDRPIPVFGKAAHEFTESSIPGVTVQRGVLRTPRRDDGGALWVRLDANYDAIAVAGRLYGSPALPFWEGHFSYWLLVTLTAAAPVVWTLLRAHHFVRATASRRARRLGRCPRCRYDLRASPDRCPECGTPAKVNA